MKIGFFDVYLVVFTYLKLTDGLELSWWYIAAPLMYLLAKCVYKAIAND